MGCRSRPRWAADTPAGRLASCDGQGISRLNWADSNLEWASVAASKRSFFIPSGLWKRTKSHRLLCRLSYTRRVTCHMCFSWPPMAGCVNATKAQRRASSTRSVDPLPLRNKQKSLEAICTSSGRSGNSGNGKFEYLKMLLKIDPIPEISDSGFSRNT